MEYGCIGRKLGHSFSKIIHNKLCDYDYELKELEPEEVAPFMTAHDFKAINVTIPYKETVIPFLDGISDFAKKIGAVNTVVNKNGKLYGYNTDFMGMSALLSKNGIDPKGKKCAVLGTGGTSKTANAVLSHLGAREVLTVSRREGAGVITYETLKAEHADTQIIINTTPCGMFPNNDTVAVDISGFKKLEGVADAVYNPLRPELVVRAQGMGVTAVGGLYMLVAQAVFAANKFTGKEFDTADIDRVFNEVYRSKRNIVLVGMPGCGKSTQGRRIAEALGFEFYDSDAEIVKKAGMPIPEIFEKQGEKTFRDLEESVISELSQKNGCVIATGGGAVLRENNVRRLKQNGVLLLIDRPIDEIKHGRGRPLAPDREKLLALYRERMPIYNSVCDIHAVLRGTKDENTKELLRITENEG